MPRPKGSKNKRTLGVPADLAAILESKDPAQILQDVYSMPMSRLKDLVRSKAGAAAIGLKLRAAEAAMPYVHSKMPIAVSVDELNLPTLVIVRDGHQKMQQIQSLMKAIAVRRDDGADVVEVKANDIKDVEDQNR